MKKYEHTQPGYLLITAIAVIAVIIIFTMINRGVNSIALVVLVFIAVLGYLFSSLTVTITDDNLEAKFGPGLIRKRFCLEDIKSVQAVKNHWYNGWGIRLTANGWLYSVSGLDAVEIELESGTRFRIGTDAPYELEMALQLAIGS